MGRLSTGTHDMQTQTRPRQQTPRNQPQPADDILIDAAIERAVIGAVLCFPDAIITLRRMLEPEDFGIEPHRLIWRTMVELSEHGTPPDLALVNAALERAATLDASQRDLLLPMADMMAEAQTPHYANHYAERVLDLSEQRRLYNRTTDALTAHYRGETTSEELVMSLPEMLREARRVHRSGSYLHLSDVDDDILGPPIPRAFFGGHLVELDNLIGGIEGGQMVAIGARPSVGKTAFLLQGLWQIASEQGVPVGMVSLEMPGRSLKTRLLAYLSGVDVADLRRRRVVPNGRERQLLEAAREEIRLTPIFVDEEPRRTVDSIVERIRAMHAEQQVGVVGIDYLQLMVQEKRAENRAQELSRISATIKQLAMELDIPIICLAQLNRGIESRAGDPAPKLSDFKDSGSIEQDADVAVMLHRDEAFKEQVLGKEAERSTRTFIRMGVEKNRNGATGRVMFEYVPHETKFLSLDAEIRSSLKGKEAA